jgi:hypothetical protein
VIRFALIALLAAAPAAGQDLDARIHGAAVRGAITWVGYRVPKVAGRDQVCDGDHVNRIALEGATELIVLARIENGTLTRVRLATPDCEIDSTGATLVWLTDVSPDDSIKWLSSLVSGASQGRERTSRVLDPALAALSMHRGDAATTALAGFARTHAQPRIRGQALFWLAHRAGDAALATITSAIDNDPETEVKKRAVFALSQLPKDEGVPKLLEVARTHRNPEVRRQAFFWLGQSNDPRATDFFERILLGK